MTSSGADAPWHVGQAEAFFALEDEYLKERKGRAPVEVIASARRSFLKGALSIAAIGVGSVAFKHDAIREALLSIGETRNRAIEAGFSTSTSTNKLFALQSSNYALHPGHIHYRYPGSPHHDDLNNLTVIAKDFLASEAQFHLVSNVELLKANALNTDIIASGSPMSNMLSRIALGYHRISEDSSKGLRREGPQFFDLPFEFIFDSAYLKSQGITAVSRKHGDQLHTVPNWSILDNLTKTYFIPQATAPDDWSLDYLLVTVLPNIFSLDDKGYSTKLVLLMGTHGVGTRSANLFFTDETLRAKISDFAAKEPFFQALIPVNKIMHSSGSLIPVGADASKAQLRPIKIVETDFRLALDMLTQERGRRMVQGFELPMAAALAVDAELRTKNDQDTFKQGAEVDKSSVQEFTYLGRKSTDNLEAEAQASRQTESASFSHKESQLPASHSTLTPTHSYLSDFVDFVGEPKNIISRGDMWIEKIRAEKGIREFAIMVSGKCLAIDVDTGEYVIGRDPDEAAYRAVDKFGRVPLFISPRFKRIAA